MNLVKLPGRTRHWFCLIALLALVTVSLFWFVLPESWQVNESSDFASFYEPVARNMLNGEGMRLTDGSPGTKYPPGFPIILAFAFAVSDQISFTNLNTLNLLILLSVVFSALIIFSIGHTLYPPQFALIAVLLWLTYPIGLWITKQPNSEVAFLPFFLGAVALFWHSVQRESNSNRLFFAVGVLIGCAMLIRPVAIGLGFVFLLLLLIWRQQEGMQRWLVPGILLLIGNIAVVLPWLIWLYQQTGQLMLLSSNGPDSIRDGLTFAVNLKGYRDSMVVPPDINHVMRSFLKQASILNSLGAVFQALWSQFIDTPVVVVRLLLWKAARSWYATDSHRLERALIFIQLVYLVPISLGAVAAWRRKGISKQAVMMILMISLYFWAMTTLVLSIVRYMVPIMPLLMLLVPFMLLNPPISSVLRFGADE